MKSNCTCRHFSFIPLLLARQAKSNENKLVALMLMRESAGTGRVRDQVKESSAGEVEKSCSEELVVKDGMRRKGDKRKREGEGCGQGQGRGGGMSV